MDELLRIGRAVAGGTRMAFDLARMAVGLPVVAAPLSGAIELTRASAREALAEDDHGQDDVLNENPFAADEEHTPSLRLHPYFHDWLDEMGHQVDEDERN